MNTDSGREQWLAFTPRDTVLASIDILLQKIIRNQVD